MESVIFAVRFLAVSQVLLLLISLSASRNPPSVKFYGTALFICVVGYLLGPVAQDNNLHELAAFLFVLASLTPMFIVLFILVAFEEQSVLPNWAKALIALNVLLELVSHYHFLVTGETTGFTRAVQLIEMSLTVVALYLLWKGKEEDLVEARTKLRNWSICSIAALSFLIAFLHLVTAHLVPEGFKLFFMMSLFGLTLSINFAMLKMNPTGKLASHGKPKIVENKDPQITTLLDRMESERLYADHDLRVAKLAEMVGLPEHHLRRKINKQLGFRNFNQFVNQYRIEEAGLRLNQEPNTPVLSLALDVGFRSISSFNTAFQNQFGMSPTEYRRQSAA